MALRAVVERNLADASVEAISPDTRFGCAYEAAGIVDAREVDELLARVGEFRARVKRSLETRFPGVWS